MLVHRRLLTAGPPPNPTGPCGTPYVVGNALVLGGTNDYLTVNSNAGLQQLPGLTVAGFVKLASVATTQQILTKSDSSIGANDAFNFWYDQPNNAFSWRVRTDVGVSSDGLFLTPPSAGVWYFVMGYWDATAGQIGLSMNDGAVETDNRTGSATVLETQPLRFGAYSDGTQKLNGSLYRWGIWNRKLSAAEVTSVYAAGLGLAYGDLTAGLLSGLISRWEMGEEAGSATVCDFHSTNHLSVAGAIGTEAGP